MVETRMGRPRSESTRLAILEAVRDLTVEVGFASVTMDSIAARAGAGKQTLYRWWSSKSHILADAVVEGHLGLPTQSVPNTGHLDDDLRSWLSATCDAMNDPRARQIVRALATAASDDEDEAGKLFAHSTEPQYQHLIARLRLGQDAGQLSASVDSTAVAEALIGSILFRLLTGLPFTDKLDGVVQALLIGSAIAPDSVDDPGLRGELRVGPAAISAFAASADRRAHVGADLRGDEYQ